MEIIERNIEDLIEAEYNPRQLSEDQFKHIKDSLTRFGFVDPVIVNMSKDRKNIIVGGHQRLKVWASMGKKTAPTVEVNLDRDKERELNIRLNKNVGSWDWDGLANHFEMDELTEWGFTADDFTGFDDSGSGEGGGDDPGAGEPPKKPKTELGRMYQLGKHRLMCGDSTSEKDVARLMDGEKADMVFTDPPYALFGNSTGIAGVADDKMVRPFFRHIAHAVTCSTIDGAHVYSCLDWHSWTAVNDSYAESGLTVKNMIVWDKERGALGNLYRMQHELIWVGINRAFNKNRTLANKGNSRPVTDVNVWQCSRVSSKDRSHNAAKPVEIISRAIENSCDSGGMVLDLFGGSGSTLIACQQTGRSCRMMELDPGYCDVIVKRYAEMVKADPAEIFKTGVHI